jgi:hypothetical protein
LLVIFLAIGKCSMSDYAGSSGTSEAVYNSPSDGTVLQAKAYLLQNINDPDSFEAIEWGTVNKMGNGNYQTWCRYRAKNSFGGYEISKKLFILAPTGEVMSMHEMGD